MRVSAFIDGFNLYHAVDATGMHHLKWLDLRALCEKFAPRHDYDLRTVYYFSAYATWRADAYARHRAFIRALTLRGVTPILGKFKEKDRHCHSCGSAWKDHEEKETDVNLALHIVRDAFEDTFDRALVISGDSDLAPALRMLRSRFPTKEIRVIAPVGRAFSMDLVNAAGGVERARKMKLVHLEHSLLPATIADSAGNAAVTRPAKYDPPI